MSTFKTTVLTNFINYRLISLFGLSIITTAAVLSINTTSSIHHKEIQLPLLTTPQVVLKTLTPAAVIKDIVLPPTYSYKVKKGDTLSEIFSQLNLPQSDVKNIMAADLNSLQIDNLRPNDILRFWVTDSNHRLNKLQLQFNVAHMIDYTREKNNDFTVKEVTLPGIWREKVISGEIRGSFSSSAKRAGLSYTDIHEIMAIFKDKLNFDRDLQAGDRFEIVSKAKYVNNQASGDTELQAVRLYTKKNQYSAYLSADGNFYDQNGESLQPAFLRYPTAKRFRISSQFNPYRRHPVTRRIQPHNGVDFAAPVGTHVLATGDGVVTRVTNHPYAGRYVVIKHSANYSTRYLHNSRILVKVGQRVKRGQEIALSGRTGRVTGPHIHYELLVRGKPVNPLTAKIPLASSVSHQQKKAFELDVTQYNHLMRQPLSSKENNI
ncbi:peptidoglycan DD-metalloendopeptidase family protein [Photobacterium carnosum]|uniref:peptidoglycan DD-metalloendopeptidase family protein n=1 Tax=Photobacterium carnosum TaxID=2023717 RepID=UPI001C91DD2B|nr:peptidoglycan DD-metalloendopeptidase family protein [Photobacterium carnosum]MBY3787717.1 peptidoglycan DD-metalloendopeptidase family protein [Photobacterium carnosum]MCD9532347.1 peptidoglycan DD-metalloendopeptidase family protein [Photobacterium carnosum]